MTTSQDTKEHALEAGDYDCALCLKLLYDPCTACCGHSFCKRCAYELVASHCKTDETNNGRISSISSLKCPICRAALDKRWVPSSSIALCRLLKLTFAKEYEARTAEEAALEQASLIFHTPHSQQRDRRNCLFLSSTPFFLARRHFSTFLRSGTDYWYRGRCQSMVGALAWWDSIARQ